MTPEEKLGLRNLQNQYPNSRITVDQYGAAIIEPVDPRTVHRSGERAPTTNGLSVGLGRSTLLKLEVEIREE